MALTVEGMLVQGELQSHCRKQSRGKKELEQEVPIIAFEDDVFLPEYRSLIPNLPPELVIPKAVGRICSAITAGDIRAVLFHGPQDRQDNILQIGLSGNCYADNGCD